MSEPTPLDVEQPFPDAGHEAIRQWVKQALAESADNAAGVGDSYFLTDLLFSLLDGAFASIDDLTARLDVLSPPTP